MKLLKPKKIPSKFLKIIYSTYSWGFDDCKEGKEKKTFEEVKESVTRGFREGIAKRKD